MGFDHYSLNLATILIGNDILEFLQYFVTIMPPLSIGAPVTGLTNEDILIWYQYLLS